MSKNADLPAFPNSELDRSGTALVSVNKGGLTKREIFAKAAMQAIISNPAFAPGHLRFNTDNLAYDSVLAADKVLRELEKTK